MTVKKELKEMFPLHAERELEILEKLCHILVEIDNFEHDTFEHPTHSYEFQDQLIEMARKHNGEYGI